MTTDPTPPSTASSGGLSEACAELEAIANILERPPLSDVRVDESVAASLARCIRLVVPAALDTRTDAAAGWTINTVPDPTFDAMVEHVRSAMRTAVDGEGDPATVAENTVAQWFRRMSALPSAGEVGTGNALTLRWTIGIGKDGSVYDDTETFGNSFAEVYAGFHAIKAELERQIAARRECPFNPVNPQPPVFTNAAETGSGDAVREAWQEALAVAQHHGNKWRKEARKHHRVGRTSDCKARDLARASICDAIAKDIATLIPLRPAEKLTPTAPPAPPVVEAGGDGLREANEMLRGLREAGAYMRGAYVPGLIEHHVELAGPPPAPVAQAEEALGEEEMRLLTLWADQASTSIYGVPNAPKRLIAAARASRVAGAEGALRERLRQAFYAWVREDTGNALKLTLTGTQTEAALDRLSSAALARPSAAGTEGAE